MHKPDGLRRLLLAAVPGLKDNPERLELFVERGQIAAQATSGLSFQYCYTLSLLFTDYVGEVDAIMVPILAWIAEQQPELLRRDSDPFLFEAELQDASAADVRITIELSERVRVTLRDGGGYDAVHLDEPAPAAAADAYPGVCGVLLRQIYEADEGLLAQSADPAWSPA